MTRSSSTTNPSPAIAGISYVFPAESRTVRQMSGDGLLRSSPETLEAFGFDRVHVARTESPYDLALRASQKLLVENSIDPESIGVVIYGGTPGPMAFSAATDSARGAAGLCTSKRFMYPVARLRISISDDRRGGVLETRRRSAVAARARLGVPNARDRLHRIGIGR